MRTTVIQVDYTHESTRLTILFSVGSGSVFPNTVLLDVDVRTLSPVAIEDVVGQVVGKSVRGWLDRMRSK